MAVIRNLLFVTLAFAALAGPFASAQTQPTAPSGPVTPPVAGTSAAASIADLSYRLGAGDKLRIVTYGEATLTGEFFVGATGTVAVPLIGEIRASDRTVAEFSKAVELALKDGFLINPSVSVQVLTSRPFYILGEVGKPGEYPYTSGLTVQNAAAMAGGFSYRANTKRVFIKHQAETAEREYPLNSTTPVQPGDTVRIGERFF